MTASDIVLEFENGKKTGNGLVFLESESRCNDGIEQLDKKEIKGRYIELLKIKLRS